MAEKGTGKIKLEFDRNGCLTPEAWELLKDEMSKAGSTYIAFDPVKPPPPPPGPKQEPWPVGEGGICGTKPPIPPPPLDLCLFRRIGLRNEGR